MLYVNGSGGKVLGRREGLCEVEERGSTVSLRVTLHQMEFVKPSGISANAKVLTTSELLYNSPPYQEVFLGEMASMGTCIFTKPCCFSG